MDTEQICFPFYLHKFVEHETMVSTYNYRQKLEKLDIECKFNRMEKIRKCQPLLTECIFVTERTEHVGMKSLACEKIASFYFTPATPFLSVSTSEQ